MFEYIQLAISFILGGGLLTFFNLRNQRNRSKIENLIMVIDEQKEEIQRLRDKQRELEEMIKSTDTYKLIVELQKELLKERSKCLHCQYLVKGI